MNPNKAKGTLGITLILFLFSSTEVRGQCSTNPLDTRNKCEGVQCGNDFECISELCYDT
jgi:hypothetical protein